MVMPCNRPGLQRLWDYNSSILAEYFCVLNEEYFVLFLILKSTNTFVFMLFFCNLLYCVYFCCASDSFLLKNASGLFDCVITEPSWVSQVSVYTSKTWL